VLLGGFGAETAKKILKRFKYDNDTTKTVTQLIVYRDLEMISCRKYIKRRLYEIGEENFRQLIEIKKAKIMAETADLGKQKLNALNESRKSLKEIIEQGQCFSLGHLAVNGRDLIDAGVPEGTKIGEILKKLVDMVIEEKAENDKTVLLEIVQKLTEG
ncbi:MAG: polynucleotide adenylyltransferase, partial [Oscillospiraceae bacterium]|nr:polynucleotide adenylyltransferase [Oscillospiraceae bacterium]